MLCCRWSGRGMKRVTDTHYRIHEQKLEDEDEALNRVEAGAE